MPKFCVDFLRIETSLVRASITVNADSPDVAKERARLALLGDIELTDEEAATEQAGKEELISSDFHSMADTEPLKVSE